jgi:hypothetical protein
MPVVVLGRLNILTPDDLKAWCGNDMSILKNDCNLTLIKTTHIIDDRELIAYDCFGGISSKMHYFFNSIIQMTNSNLNTINSLKV